MGASPTKQTAPPSAPLHADPVCSAVCVLPTPPVPVSVTIRWSRTSMAISSSCASRPTKLVNASGRLDVPALALKPPATEALPGRTPRDRATAASKRGAARCRATVLRRGVRAFRVGACADHRARGADAVGAHPGAFGERFCEVQRRVDSAARVSRRPTSQVLAPRPPLHR